MKLRSRSFAWSRFLNVCERIVKRQLAKNFLLVSGLLEDFLRPVLSKLSEGTRYVLSLKSAVRHCASGGTTSGGTAKRTQRGRGSACVLLFKRGKVSWLPGLSVFGVWAPVPWCAGRVGVWAPLAFYLVVWFRWRDLSSGPVVLGLALWALFLPVSLLRPATCRAGSPWWWSVFQGGATTQGPIFRQVSPLLRPGYVRMVCYGRSGSLSLTPR